MEIQKTQNLYERASLRKRMLVDYTPRYTLKRSENIHHSEHLTQKCSQQYFS